MSSATSVPPPPHTCSKISTAKSMQSSTPAPLGHGVESTVLDPTQSPMIIYRPGAITDQQIRDVGGPVDYFEERTLPITAVRESLPSPGVGLRHYAPQARLILVDATLPDLPAQLVNAGDGTRERSVCGIMLPAELAHTSFDPPLRGAVEFAWGHWNAPEELAEKLYAGLRALDVEGCTVILCPLPKRNRNRRSDPRSPPQSCLILLGISPAVLLPGFAELIHVLDCSFINKHLRAPAHPSALRGRTTQSGLRVFRRLPAQSPLSASATESASVNKTALPADAQRSHRSL